jgi:hypothetical protein
LLHLIINFNLVKNIISLCFHEHKNSKLTHFSSIFKEANFRVLHLWCQASKPKGLKVGLEQTSRPKEHVERSQTGIGPRLSLSSVLTDPLELQVKVKRSGSAQEPLKLDLLVVPLT